MVRKLKPSLALPDTDHDGKFVPQTMPLRADTTQLQALKMADNQGVKYDRP